MSNTPLPEPYGRITTHTITGQQFFYRWPESPYLDNAKECIEVVTYHDLHTYAAAVSAADNAALREVIDAARRLVEHADFQLGGILSADSKAKDIPSKAVSQVKARHLASLRDRLAALGDKT